MTYFEARRACPLVVARDAEDGCPVDVAGPDETEGVSDANDDRRLGAGA